jgi:hypothetical protein
VLLKLAPSTPGSLVGDLQEEYESGRSAGWYWRQVLRAVTVAIARQMHAHRWETVRGIVAGWVCLEIFGKYVFPTLVAPDDWLFVRGVTDIRPWWPDFTARQIWYVSAPFACASVGWIIARFHRRETVLIFVGTVLLWNLPHFFVLIGELSIAQIIRDVLLVFVVFPLSTVAGGLLATRAADVSPASNTAVHLSDG